MQTPDSAGTATAYLCGVKTVKGKRNKNNCCLSHTQPLKYVIPNMAVLHYFDSLDIEMSCVGVQ